MTGILNIPADQYHRDELADTPTLSESLIHTMLTASPKHAWAQHPRLNPSFKREDDQKFDAGNACHALMLEGRNAVQVIDADSWRTNEAKAMRDSARESGQIPMLTAQWAEIEQVIPAWRERLLAFDVDPPLFQVGTAEQTLIWQESGVWCRARLDWLHDDLSAIDDLKTTSRLANPESWARQTMWSIGATTQARFYQRGILAVTGKEPDFRFCVAEIAAPYELSVISLDPSAVALADAKINRALEMWRECLASDVWPGYPSRVCWAEAPSWEESRWLEREAREVAA